MMMTDACTRGSQYYIPVCICVAILGHFGVGVPVVSSSDCGDVADIQSLSFQYQLCDEEAPSLPCSPLYEIFSLFPSQ